MQSRGSLWAACRRAGGAQGVPAASFSLSRRPGDPVTAWELATYALGKGGAAGRSVGPGVRRRRWRLGLPLEGPPGLCPAGLLRIPRPGPAAGAPPPAAPRFVYGAPEDCPHQPPPLASEAEWPLQKLPPAAEGSVSAVVVVVGGRFAWIGGEGSPPPLTRLPN